jgi:GT2 family glycosyltransferase
MSFEPLLSIITVSAFDKSRLSKTLKSLAGLPSEVEHVIITPEDDYDSKSLLKSHEFSGQNQLLLAHDNNKGVYAAMNSGALVANGKYICFWNAGDRLNTQNDLKNLINTFRLKEPIWAISQGIFDWRSKQELSVSSLYKFVTHVPNTFISHQTIFVEKKTFIEIGMFDIRYKVAADTAQITKLFLIEPPVFEESEVVLVETPNFASKNHRRARFEVLIIVFRYLSGFQKMQALLNILQNEIYRIARKIK